MNEWGFLRSRRWAGYLALVVVFAIVCCALGVWQFARRAEARAEIARIDANYDAQAVPVDEVLPELDEFDIDQRWTVVALDGEYLDDEEVVVRNRPGQGGSGFEVLTPMRLQDGTVFVVDRGWVAQDSEGRPSEYAPPPTGRVEVEARLKAGEGQIDGRTSAGDEFATIDLDELAERVGEPTYTGAYGLLVQSGAEADEPPVAASRPLRDEGPHLSYALQWFVFAIMGFVGLAWAANQERKARAEASGLGDSDAGQSRPSLRKVHRTPRKDADADLEDGVLDRS
ncbi:cytochrome oxidase assembly protein ShyY1 [Agromyces terreus]|uniref:SURF1-like protein n=1 Tax=Agromyces terreus TaxID=424795 RepID=A0A9X2H8J5_9MICO|nr:SURF1 family protein [Agromyces terreus]MCP2371974.1 cytochrome oxidase assembly protein ShyY1 [Agromyces terreus]